jgi:hypothetical protein
VRSCLDAGSEGENWLTDFRHLQQREEHWAMVDLVGKGGHIRTVPIPEWVKATVDIWTTAADLSASRVFRCAAARARTGATV